ncbi:hypothetical protein BDV26DRAFT_295916 [Aspergillus bertholletiae]|uniref:Uncharacterized protein n=1 Tax=Aspergillus bertholletiae TaxID=1226010 RepID=A0A5N7AYQ9_9EURO|nr:hypothetical protein BDV26DRAFT_295916 [Aspergillus bertholletiae]
MLPKISSLACLLVLTFLAMVSISESHPIAEMSTSRALHARSPDPRIIPSSDSLVNSIFSSVGLDNLAKLDHWKQNQATDESDSAAPTKTQNEVTSSGNHTAKQMTPSELPDPTQDNSKFMSELLQLLSSKLTKAWHSSDEHTLN